ncbi:hypothetical protein G3M48_003237 [Beauveria asiatica]|uniref:Protein kinase domain-containing protein n=1 Tax=Beauveria asiatica TaxID=1069075 RepID=A0AAW0RWU2_9HYPO
MAAQPDHDSQAPPIYHPDQAMLHLLRASYPDYSPQHPVPPSLSSQPSPNAQKHTPPNTHSDIPSTHRSPVGFAPPPNQDHSRRPAREVVPGLPRTQTLKRQQSERREHLTPVEMPPEERRAASSDIKSPFSILTGRDHASFATPSAFDSAFDAYSDLAFSATSSPRLLEDEELQNSEDDEEPPRKAPMHVPPPTLQPGVTLIPGTNLPDTTNMPREKFDALIESELENVWILNLSMHFRDRSRREKFFLTYRERETIWRRVTISIDYRDAPPDSLEGELAEMKLQRDKSAKMYEALRDSLPDIHFYDTATNLTLKTSEGRLHVHVVEDANEKIDYPRVETLKHLNCLMVKECDIVFDSHMSGFVYKIRVGDQVMVKKEVPGAETVEEFLYEIHALHSLQDSDHVIRFRGLVTDNDDEIVKALLLDYCPGGTLIDKIYDDCKTTYLGIPWRKRERWARQVIHGVADLHESGFVQGDLTLANVVLDDKENARIIDVNRRGCPVGWEPPEAKPLVDTNQRLSLYIGVKSDLFQLGMLLWALAMEEDEPEIQGRPLLLGPEVNIPDWYRQITEICLSHDPRSRLMASQLLTMIPDQSFTPAYSRITSRPAVDHRHSPRELSGENALNAAPISEIKNEQLTFPQRGRSPPSPMPSDSSRQRQTGWAANIPVAASYDDMAAKAKRSQERERSFLGDASKDSTTPPASFAAMLPPKQPSPSKRLSPPKQPTPPTQTSTYFDTVNSDISMWSPSEETVAYPSSTSPPHDLVTKIHDELLEDLERNGAARSALQAIFGRSNDNYAPVAQNTAQLRNDSTVSKYPTQRADEATNIPQSPPRPDNTSSTDQITTQLDKSASEISQTTTRRADDGFNPPATAQLENASNSRPFISKLVKKDYTSLQTNAPLEKGLTDYPTTAKKDSDASTVCQLTTQWPDDAVTIPQTTPQRIDHASCAPETTTQRGNNVATIRNSSAQWTDDAALDPQMNPKRIGIPAQRDESVSMNTKTTTRQAENASNVPRSNRQRDDSASIKDQSSFQREHNATVTLQTTAEREQSIKMTPQIASQWEQNTTITSQTATQLENSSTMPQTTDQLDDNVSVASYMSRTSSPDGDLEGGAQLSRSDTAFSVVNTHFQRPEYTTISKVPLETIIDTPLTAFDQHLMDKPNGTLPNLGPGQGIAAPLHTDLKTDIRFDSSLWPDTTRRFMTDTKS